MLKGVLFFLLVRLAASSPLKNITLTVPNGTSTHEEPNLLCTPTRWTDIIIFFLGNYVAHAATAISLPGERWEVAATTAVAALLFPTSGVCRGVMTIWSFAKFAKNDMCTAAKAGALCMVVRSREWRPTAGDKAQYAVCRVPSATKPYGESPLGLRESRQQYLYAREQDRCSASEDEGQDILNFVTTSSTDSIGPKKQVVVQIFEDPWVERIPDALSRYIHGSHKLPPGYSFAIVPADAEFESNTDSDEDSTISSNYNLIKILVSGGQSLFSSITLYRSRGDQIDHYGFAAFGLTVAPYAVMSIVNLLGSLMVPSYQTMYIVRSSISDEASRRHGCHLDGLCGRLMELDDDKTSFLRSKNTQLFWIRDFIHFERDCDENNETDLYNAENNNAKWGLKVSFKTSMDQHLGFQSVHSDSISHAEPNPLFELLPPKVEFCFSMKDKIGLPPKKPSPSEAIVFVPDSSLITRTSKDQRRWLRRSDIPVEADRKYVRHDQNIVHCSMLGPNAKYFNPTLMLTVFIICLIPLAIIGGLSGFKRRSATLSQEVWTMTWLIYGGVVGAWSMILWGMLATLFTHFLTLGLKSLIGRALLGILVYGLPSIGGFVVVGQMLRVYGTCHLFT